MRHQIQQSSETDKNMAIAKLAAHKMRAKAFHKLMKEEPVGSKTFVFDLQQVQPTSKLAIGECYYSRQISLYNLCVTSVNAAEPTFYLWTEKNAGRGAEEVSSAVTDFLTNFKFDRSTIDVRLFADGCGGQNKNQHVIHALGFWLLKHSPPHITKLVIVYPVRGHSFLPADRVFGRVEKKIRQVPEILSPPEYVKIYREVGEVKVLGVDWTVKDYKELTGTLKKLMALVK